METASWLLWMQWQYVNCPPHKFVTEKLGDISALTGGSGDNFRQVF